MILNLKSKTISVQKKLNEYDEGINAVRDRHIY